VGRAYAYIASVQASVTKSGDVTTAPTALGYVIAFTLGYREETFRGSLQRVTDLVVSAGGGDIEPPSTPSDRAGEAQIAAGDATGGTDRAGNQREPGGPLRIRVA
jgi:hypothetical protein